MTQALFFDFDGVILESAGIKTRAFEKLFEKDFPERISEIVRYHKKNMGISRFVKFRRIYEDILGLPLSENEEKRLGLRFAEIVSGEVLRAPFVAGLEDFLKKNSMKYSMFVISGTPEAELREIARRRGLFEYFREWRGTPGEKKEILADLLLRYRWKPGEAAYVGDADSDYEACLATGVQFIARVGGDGLDARRCEHRIRDLTELEKILSQLQNNKGSEVR